MFVTTEMPLRIYNDLRFPLKLMLANYSSESVSFHYKAFYEMKFKIYAFNYCVARTNS